MNRDNRDEHLVDILMNSPDWSIDGVRGRETAWEHISPKEIGRFQKFSQGYFHSLKNKSIYQRLDYIRQYLERHGFVTYKDVIGVEPEQPVNGAHRRYKPGTKFYFLIGETMLVAVELGSRPLEDGLYIGGAHIDSVGLVGRINKVAQNFNLALLPAAGRGGIFPKDYFNVPLSFHFHGIVSANPNGDGTRGPPQTRDIVIGEKDDEPSLILAGEHYHLEEGGLPKHSQLEVLMANRPTRVKGLSEPRELEARLDALRQSREVEFTVRKFLYERHGITTEDLQNGTVWTLPSSKPAWTGFDSSMISAYGQDNWASAYCVLKGVVDSSRNRFAKASPQNQNGSYTKVAVFYDREETNDTGRGGLRDMILETLVIPRIMKILRVDDELEFEIQKNTWSIFGDVSGAVSSYDPKKHDPRDSTFLGSGVVIVPNDGDKEGYDGYQMSPEMQHALRKLFREKSISHQMGIMGTYDDIARGASHIFHPSLAQGAYIGVPILGMHRTMETTSTADVWMMYKAVRSIFSVTDRNKYWVQRAR